MPSYGRDLSPATMTYSRGGGGAQHLPMSQEQFSVRPTCEETSPGPIFEKSQPIFVIFENTYSEVTNYHSICSNINVTEMCTNYYNSFTSF
jgi:hypothetical protein